MVKWIPEFPLAGYFHRQVQPLDCWTIEEAHEPMSLSGCWVIPIDRLQMLKLNGQHARYGKFRSRVQSVVIGRDRVENWNGIQQG